MENTVTAWRCTLGPQKNIIIPSKDFLEVIISPILYPLPATPAYLQLSFWRDTPVLVLDWMQSNGYEIEKKDYLIIIAWKENNWQYGGLLTTALPQKYSFNLETINDTEMEIFTAEKFLKIKKLIG